MTMMMILRSVLFYRCKEPSSIFCIEACHHSTFIFFFTIFVQGRCEQILRSNPESRLAAEMHLASMEAQEQKDARAVKDAAVGGAVVAVAAGAIIGIASMLLKR